MIQTLSFPRKRAISELSTSLQLPTQTLFIQCKWCIVGVQQQPLGLYLDIQLKCFLNIDDGSQTYGEVSAIDRMMGILGTGTNQTAHVLRGLSQEFGQWFSPAVLPGPSTADSLKTWQGTEGMFSNVWFKGRLYFSKHLAVFVSLMLFTGTGHSFVSWTTHRKYDFPWHYLKQLER